MANDFTVVIRGYDRGQVDAALVQAAQLLEAGQSAAFLSGKKFDVVLRGYDRGQVDTHIQELLRR
ncbi:DivIVA domain-containing protein [Actinoplanes sp. NPDC051411]|uniref:DivIVA domain-containing protein n=1 Tax=Actinoplanes sp. NPDC051411 TaxID=3155522 RepID=UPI003432F074